LPETFTSVLNPSKIEKTLVKPPAILDYFGKIVRHLYRLLAILENSGMV